MVAADPATLCPWPRKSYTSVPWPASRNADPIAGSHVAVDPVRALTNTKVTPPSIDGRTCSNTAPRPAPLMQTHFFPRSFAAEYRDGIWGDKGLDWDQGPAWRVIDESASVLRPHRPPVSMQIIVDIIVPVFGIVFIAYVAAASGLFSEAATRGLSQFVFNFAIPPMLFRTMATQTLPDPIEWAYLISFFGGGYVAWAIGMAISGGVFRRNMAEASIAGMTGAFGNTVLLGIPLILTTYGEAATLPIFLIIAFHSWQLFAVVTILIEGGRGTPGQMLQIPLNILKGLAGNPIIIGLLLGLVWNIWSLPIPKPVDVIAETWAKRPCLARCSPWARLCQLPAARRHRPGEHRRGAQASSIRPSPGCCDLGLELRAALAGCGGHHGCSAGWGERLPLRPALRCRTGAGRHSDASFDGPLRHDHVLLGLLGAR